MRKERERGQQAGGETLIQLIRGWLSLVMTPTPGECDSSGCTMKANESLVHHTDNSMLGLAHIGKLIGSDIVFLIYIDLMRTVQVPVLKREKQKDCSVDG